MNHPNLIENKKGFLGPTFSLKNRLFRVLWKITWLTLARWSLPNQHKWRIFLLNAFGARVSYKAYIYPSVKIWGPWNLQMADYATLAPKVECYNIANISMGEKSIASQEAKLYTGTHDYNDVNFKLVAKPIIIKKNSWIAAGAFVGPGVCIGEGAILGARGVTFKDLEPWFIYAGNPAEKIKSRDALK